MSSKISLNDIHDAYFFRSKESNPVLNPVRSSLRILYLTNRCNLACTYCYEGLGDTFKYGGMAPAIPSLEQLIKQVDDIIAEEPEEEKQTLFLLFGGEPLMQWKNMKSVMLHAMPKKNNIHFNAITNGVLLTKPKFVEDFISFFKEHQDITQKFSLDISFDGVGNGERVYRNGKKSAPTVLKALAMLSAIDEKEMKFKWRIRYTIQRANIDHWKKDILYLNDIFNPYRIITSIDSEMNADEDANVYEKLKRDITSLRYLWETKALNTPVCGFFCDTCNECAGTHDYKYYYTDKGLTKKVTHSKNVGPFNEKTSQGSEWGDGILTHTL